MKLHEGQVDQHSSGLEGHKTMDFKIQMGAKAFAVTIDKLYMDKAKAVVREYSTNGVDANPPGVPIEVHMPSLYEPYFSVTDFGTGLAENQMEDIFCVLFKSTKDDRNDQIGALGLGCKSGFAYTDQFTVESRQGGKVTTYTATRAAGMPQMIKLVEVPMTPDQKTGLTITVPVRTPDIPLFEHAARQVYSYFEIKPKFTHKPVTLDSRGSPIVSGSFWRYYEAPKVAYGQAASVFPSRAVALMGQIAYPIDIATMAPHLTSDEKALLECPLEIDVKMGEVDIQPSREGLSYDKATIATLQTRLQAISKAICENFIKPFRDTYKTGWEIAMNYDKSWNKLSWQIQQNISSEMRKLAPNGSNLEIDATKVLGTLGKMGEAPNAGHRYNDRRLVEKWYAAHQYHGGKARITINEDTKIIIVDQIPRYIDKVMHFHGGKDLIMVMLDPTIPFDPKDWGDVPDDCVVRTSEMELPAATLVALKKKSTSPTRKVLSFQVGGYIGPEVERQWDDGGYYIKRENGNLISHKDLVSYNVCGENGIRQALLTGLIPQTDVFAINKTFWNHLKEENGWQDFWTAYIEKLQASTLLQEAVDQVERDSFISKLKNSGGMTLKFVGDLPDKQTFGPKIETARTLLRDLYVTGNPQKKVNADFLIQFATDLKLTIPKPKAIDKAVEDAIKDVLKEYPLLSLIVDNIYRGTVEEIAAGRNKYSKAVFDYISF